MCIFSVVFREWSLARAECAVQKKRQKDTDQGLKRDVPNSWLLARYHGRPSDNLEACESN